MLWCTEKLSMVWLPKTLNPKLKWVLLISSIYQGILCSIQELEILKSFEFEILLERWKGLEIHSKTKFYENVISVIKVSILPFVVIRVFQYQIDTIVFINKVFFIPSAVYFGILESNQVSNHNLGVDTRARPFTIATYVDLLKLPQFQKEILILSNFIMNYHKIFTKILLPFSSSH